jgi:hypothetical protein
MLQRKEPLEHAWQANIDSLVREECLDSKRGVHVTQIGKDLAEQLDPIVAQNKHSTLALWKPATVDLESSLKLVRQCQEVGGRPSLICFTIGE